MNVVPITTPPAPRGFLNGFSIEVMPRTAAKIPDFKAILPAGTRVYIAHIAGTPIEDMLETAKRLVADGFEVMPHFPARIIADNAMLENWVQRYAELGVSSALLLAGGVNAPEGDFSDSMQLLESGVFDHFGFSRLHVAGHPEGNRDIGTESEVMAALKWKSDFQNRTGAAMAIATQFVFEAPPVIEWSARMQAAGVHLPVHIGVAGPAKLQTLIRFSMACGVGPSLRVLTRRARDITKLIRPFTPETLLTDLAAHKAAHPDWAIESVHFFPLGGIRATTDYISAQSDTAARLRA
ncbi:MAG: methylenetetrahydrofolate reductase [Rhodobacteraceae bacterium]|nr:methylenetetrahydrofolate reductase [Paracoccaceae bacterium]